MNFAIIYYSLGGNTRHIANMIKDKISADIFEIETKTPTQALTTKLSIRGRMESTEDFAPKSKS